MTPLIGVDVASYQGYPNWGKVAASGRAFAWTKATEGTNYVNPTFAFNWQGIQAAGMVRGAYHFARPDSNSPEAEASAFLGAVGDLQATDLLALDLEAGSGNLLDWALGWLRYVEQRIGFKPLLYSGTWFLGPHGCLGSPELSQYGLWLSGYQANMPPVPPDWNVIAMWQYTSSAQVPGINGVVDESYFLGDLAQLHSYGKGAPVTPSLTVSDQIVTILSVIGDMTYPDGVNMDDQAPGQPAGVSRRIFTRQLVQQGKALLGA